MILFLSLSSVYATTNDTVIDNSDSNTLTTQEQVTTEEINYEDTTTKSIVKNTTSEIKTDSQIKNVYVSSSGSDSNTGSKSSPKASISNAITSVSNGGTVYITSGTYTEHGIKINKNITIIGSNSKNTIINCENKHLFTISENTKVTLKTFSIKNAYDANGGAIYNKGTLSLEGMRFYSNKAKNGGAIYNKGILTVYKTSFANNYASYGGAIYNLNYLKMSKSTFNKNEASQVGSAITSTGKIDIDNCNFTSNKNSAIFLNKANKYNYIKTSIFTSNTGINGACIFNKNSLLSINKTYFNSNKASQYGAVIYNSGITSIKSSSMLNSYAKYGAVIYDKNYTSITNSSMKNNVAKYYGGVIYSTGTVTLSSDKIEKNTAHIGAVIYSDSNNKDITIKSCQIVSNNAKKYASVLYLTGKGKLNLTSSVIAYNNRRSIYIHTVSTIKHSIYNTNFTSNTGEIGSAVFNEKSVINMTRCIISSNNASVHGSIYNYEGKLNLSYSILKNNNNIDLYNHGGTLIANYNWWSTNNKVSQSRAYNTTVKNWIYLNLIVNTANVGEKTNITTSINNIYNGSKITKINGSLLPKFNIKLTVNGCNVSKTYNPTTNTQYSVSLTFNKAGDVKVTAYTYNAKVQKEVSIKSRLFDTKITSLFVQMQSSVSSSNVKAWVNAGITDVYVLTGVSSSNTNKLRQVISLCKNTNIRVHAWVICFSTDNGFNIGSSRQNLVKSFIKKVIQIDGVDGICLDYVRYSGTRANVDSSVVTNFVKSVNSIVKGYDNSLIISACVFAEKAATKVYYGQDYAALSKYVDVLLPMAYKYDYGQDRSWLKSVTAYVVAQAKYSKVVTTIQTYKESGGSYTTLSKSELEADAKAVMSAGSYGYCLFRYGLISSYPTAASKL